jgi:hypothetical protein
MGAIVFVVLLASASRPSLVFVTRLGLVHSISPMDLSPLVLWCDFFLPGLQPKPSSGASLIFSFGIWFGAFWPLFGLFSKAKNCYLRTMKNCFLFLLILLAFTACTPSPEEEAMDLLDKSIAAHGGKEGWENLKGIKFQKWTRMLDAEGNIESELDQRHEFRFSPRFEGKISWTKDSILHSMSWDGAIFRYQMGENEVLNADFLASKKKDFDAAFYTVAQPWKLLDKGGKLIYEGKKTLENGTEVESIRVDYGPDSDLWWYYFDPTTYLMLGNEVKLKDHRSLVYDLSTEPADKLLFHGKRESWRVAESGKRLFLRAEYRYSNFALVY